MPAKAYRLIRTQRASADLAQIRDYTTQNFGKRLALAYAALLRQAFKDILTDPFRASSKDLGHIVEGLRGYHIALSKHRVQAKVRHPRHMILYTVQDDVIVLRVLCDTSDFKQHV